MHCTEHVSKVVNSNNSSSTIAPYVGFKKIETFFNANAYPHC